jgi:hypothetical protein
MGGRKKRERSEARAESSPPRPEKQRLRGIVRARGDDPVVVRLAELEHDGATRPAPPLTRTFDLEVDGALVAVTVASDVRAVPFAERRERWEELEHEPTCAPFREDAPAPHAKVKLRSFELRDGDAIELWGATESAPTAAGFREAAERRVAVIDATLIGRGDEGAKRIDELEAEERERNQPSFAHRKPLPRLRALELASIVVCALAALAILFVPTAASRWDAVVTLALVLAVVVPGALLTAPHARFEHCGGAGPTTPIRELPYIIVFSIGWLPAMFVFVDLQSDEEGPFNHAPVSAWGGGLVLLGTAAWYAWASRREARLVRAMLAAPKQPIPWEHNRWGAVEGTVATGTVKYETKAATYSLFEETFNDGSGGNLRAWTAQGGPFVLDAGEATVRVNAAKCDWGTTIRWGRTGKSVSSDHPREVREVGLIPVGARVLVVGRVKVSDAMAEIVSTGAETLLLFATDGRTDPGSARAILEGLRLRRTAVIGIVVVAALALFALGASGLLGTIHSGSGGD